MDPDPSDITGGNLVGKAKQTDLADSRNFPEILSYAKKIAPKLAMKFGIPAEDLIQEWLVKLVEKDYPLDAVSFPKAWTFIGMYRVGLNLLRHNERERNSTEPLEWEDGHSKEGYADPQEGFAYNPTADPLEILLREEDKAALRKRVLDIVNDVLKDLPPQQRFVVRSMLRGIPAEEIAKKIRRSRPTVYRLGKESKPTFKRIVNKLGLNSHLKHDSALKGTIYDLLATSLRESSAGEYASRSYL